MCTARDTFQRRSAGEPTDETFARSLGSACRLLATRAGMELPFCNAWSFSWKAQGGIPDIVGRPRCGSSRAPESLPTDLNALIRQLMPLLLLLLPRLLLLRWAHLLKGCTDRNEHQSEIVHAHRGAPQLPAVAVPAHEAARLAPASFATRKAVMRRALLASGSNSSISASKVAAWSLVISCVGGNVS